MDLGYQTIIQSYTDFKDFVLNIEKDDLLDKIIHIKPMNYWVCNENNEIIVNKIFKIEEISEINEFLLSLGFEEKLSDVHNNYSKHGHITEYLDEQVVKEINRLYQKDFELFNYKML